MGGFPQAAQSILGEEVIHDQNCHFQQKGEEILATLSDYTEISDKFYLAFQNGESDELKEKLFETIESYPFWKNNAMKSPNFKCKGCCDLASKYMLIPMFQMQAILEAGQERFEEHRLVLGQWEEKIQGLFVAYVVDVFEQVHEMATGFKEFN